MQQDKENKTLPEKVVVTHTHTHLPHIYNVDAIFSVLTDIE